MEGIKIISAMAVFIFCFSLIYGQQKDNTADASKKSDLFQELKNEFANAPLVVEGKVIKRTGFYNDAHTRVYTSNTVIVYKLFQGHLSNDTIEVVDMGGLVRESDTSSDILGGELISHSHPLHIDEEAVFFLKPNTWNAQLKDAANSYLLSRNYRIEYWYKFAFKNEKAQAACTSYHFKDIPEVYALLQEFLGKPYTVISKNPHDKDIQK